MASLFEEMQEARRRGELAVPDEEPEEEPEPLPEVTFGPSDVPGGWSCARCFALVEHRLTAAHAEWHRSVGA